MIRIVEVMILALFSSGTIAAALAHRAFLQSESQGIYSPVSTSVYTTHRVRYCKLGAAAWFFYATAAALVVLRLLVIGTIWVAVFAALFALASCAMIAFAYAMAKAAKVWNDSQRDTTHLK